MRGPKVAGVVLSAVLILASLGVARGEDALVESSAQKLYEQVATMMDRGELLDPEVKAGMHNFRILLGLLPSKCGQVDDDTCTNIIKYGYQAEMDFGDAIKPKKATSTVKKPERGCTTVAEIRAGCIPDSPSERAAKAARTAKEAAEIPKETPKTPEQLHVLKQLQQISQKLEMEATYALGKEIISKGDIYKFDETRRQFGRLIKIDPNYKDVNELLNNTTSWMLPLPPHVAKQINQRNAESVVMHLQHYLSVPETVIDPSEIQTLVDHITAILKQPKEQQPEGIEKLSRDVQQLLERVSKDLPVVKLKFAVDWKAFPPDTGFILGAGFPVSAVFTHGGDQQYLGFTTKEEARFMYGQEPILINAILKRSAGNPLGIKLPANTTWGVCTTNPSFGVQQAVYEAFQHSYAFGQLDEHIVRETVMFDACKHVTVTNNTPL